MTATPKQIFLPKVQRVSETPRGITASCPTALHKHGDRSRGLRIKEAEDGKLLLTCGAGCSAESIVSAVGLTLADLFPAKEGTTKREAGRYVTRAMIDAVLLELWVLLVAASQMQQGEPLAPADRDRVKQAQDRVNRYWRAAA